MKKVLYKDALNKPVQECNEPFVPARKFDSTLELIYGATDRIPTENPNIIFNVRETVAKKLAEANNYIKEKIRGYKLGLGYGYRPLEIQIATFQKVLARTKIENPNITDQEELNELTNQFIAVPSIAAHPTGGAVDVAILNASNQQIDMGFPFLGIMEADRSKVSWIAEGLTQPQISNRQLLLEAMTASGFAPYWGEWWHYSFGDREWAVFYDQPNAIYSQKSTFEVEQSIEQ
jgi:D-alanyl-D-alanine dipeptidase